MRASFRFVLPLMSIAAIAGCAQAPLQVVDGGAPVTTETNWKKWKHFRPQQTVRFGDYEVISPDRDRKTKKLPFSPKIRQEEKIDFAFRKSGAVVARVSGRTRRKQKRIGPIRYDDFDRLDGQISTLSGQTATFSINGFNETGVHRDAKGEIVLNGETISIQELEPGRFQVDGFAGANFFLHGQQIGQVVRDGKRKIWVDSNQSEDVQTATAATAAVMVLASRLNPLDE